MVPAGTVIPTLQVIVDRPAWYGNSEAPHAEYGM